MKATRFVVLAVFAAALGLLSMPVSASAQVVADVPTGCGHAQQVSTFVEGAPALNTPVNLGVLATATRSPLVDALAALFSRPWGGPDRSSAVLQSRRESFARLRAGLAGSAR